MLQQKMLTILAMAAAATTVHCGGEAPQGQDDGTSTTATDALTGVQNCQSQARACESSAGDAGDPACRDAFRMCLSTLVPDGGAGMRDDAGRPMRNDRDGGNRPDRDGSAGASASAVDACMADLGTCMKSSTDPKTCAEDAITCLKASIGSSSASGGSRPPTTTGGQPPGPPTSVDAGHSHSGGATGGARGDGGPAAGPSGWGPSSGAPATSASGSGGASTPPAASGRAGGPSGRP